MTGAKLTSLLTMCIALLVAGCSSEQPVAAVPVTSLPPVTTTAPSTTTTTTTTTTITLPPVFDLTMTVTQSDGTPLSDAVVGTGRQRTITGPDGSVTLRGTTAGTVEISRFGWLPVSVDWTGDEDPVAVMLEPRIVRGLRVPGEVVADPERFAATLRLADTSTVNTLVFDTKDESSDVLYESASEFAAAIGSINPVYDPVALIAAAKERDLYTITRIVTFEDALWAKNRPEHQLAGHWIDPTIEEGWEYPLGLAVEACQLGFDEIQFDYVRFPAGKTAKVAQADKPLTEEERVTAITAFLAEARSRLHPMGCAVSADIFAIVLSSPNDQGIGQRPEDVSAVVDTVSPMIYPSHYSEGWLDFDDPNDHPGPVVAHALDTGMARMASGTTMRPWLQSFYYNSDQILAEINEAESRGVGWILWNSKGNYAESSLPKSEEE